MRLTVILFVVEGVVLVGSRWALPDPFVPYEAIAPGQPSDALENFPCTIFRDDASTVSCIFSLTDGPFTSVRVQYDHEVKRIDFVVRPDDLHLSDLILCWGAPTSVGPQKPPDEIGWADVEWGKLFYAEIVAGWNDIYLSYSVPVYYVSIAGEWRSCGLN